MKTRIIYTKFWKDKFIVKLEPLERYLFNYYLTNEKVNIIHCYECTDREVMFDTGVDEETLLNAKKKFEEAGKIAFYEDYVYLVNAGKYETYRGTRNKIAKQKIINEMSEDVKDWYKRISDRGIDRRNVTPQKGTINHKSKIINQKSEIISKKSEIRNHKLAPEKKENNLPTRYKKAFEKPNRRITTAHQDRAFKAAEALGIDLKEAEKQGFEGATGSFVNMFKNKSGIAESVFTKLVDSGTYANYDNVTKLKVFFSEIGKWKLKK